MAFTEKTKNGVVVRHGGTGEVLKRFTGKDADEQAKAHMLLLHKKFNPKPQNRGKQALLKLKRRS